MGTLSIILQLILSLSILVVLHELGHFIPAKWFKTRVEKFYLFFDPYFSLFKYKKGETEYGIGWLPLGGYVKISGMIDESMDTDQMAGPPQPWEFRSKKPWQKLIIMVGGVTVNFILGIFLMSMIALVWGEDYLETSKVINGIYVDEIGEEIGLRNGDKILSIGGQDFDEFSSSKLRQEVIFNDADHMMVERNGRQERINLADTLTKKLAKYENSRKRIFDARMPAVIGIVGPDHPAGRAGLMVNDEITAINGKPIRFFDEVTQATQSNPSLDLTIRRAGKILQKNVSTQHIIPPKGLKKLFGAAADTISALGINPQDKKDLFDYSHRSYGLGASISYGFTESFSFLGDQLNAFSKMFTGKIAAKESLGGFISIAKIFPAEWDWKRFWKMTAILSLILGFMNILPIPALDGGHILFLLLEMASGRKFSDKFIERATTGGFFVLMALLLYVNGLDIFRTFF